MTAPTTDPGRALVGAALSGVPQVLELIRDDDLADPRLSVVASVVRQLAEAGAPVDPTTVLAHARATGTVTRADAVQTFALLLHELVAGCPLPASARFYAAAVLDDRIRGRCEEMGARILQASDGGPLDSLLDLVDREHQAVRELAARRAAIASAPARLRAVSA